MLNSILHKNLRGLKNNEHELERTTHIVGDNGSGKTTILEAVTLLLTGKTFLSVNKNNLIRTNQSQMVVSGNPTCIVDANIISVSSGVPAYRRGLIDRAVFHVEPSHAKNHREFKRCLTQRNRVLSKKRPQQEINAWNEPLALAGEKISKARQDLLMEAKPYFKEVTNEMLGSGYGFSFVRGWKAKTYLESLLKNEKKDVILKSTSRGPQKEDFKLLCLDKKTKIYSSHGEEKLASIAFVVSLNMAIEKRKKTLSTMLFDELESGLDNNGLFKLVNIIKSLKNQILITSLVHHSVSKKIKGNILYPEQN